VLDLFIMDADGSNQTHIIRGGSATIDSDILALKVKAFLDGEQGQRMSPTARAAAAVLTVVNALAD
jgi:hypothetical protein